MGRKKHRRGGKHYGPVSRFSAEAYRLRDAQRKGQPDTERATKDEPEDGIEIEAILPRELVPDTDGEPPTPHCGQDAEAEDEDEALDIDDAGAALAPAAPVFADADDPFAQFDLPQAPPTAAKPPHPLHAIQTIRPAQPVSGGVDGNGDDLVTLPTAIWPPDTVLSCDSEEVFKDRDKVRPFEGSEPVKADGVTLRPGDAVLFINDEPFPVDEIELTIDRDEDGLEVMPGSRPTTPFGGYLSMELTGTLTITAWGLSPYGERYQLERVSPTAWKARLQTAWTDGEPMAFELPEDVAQAWIAAQVAASKEEVMA